jgi:hypothetical protein
MYHKCSIHQQFRHFMDRRRGPTLIASAKSVVAASQSFRKISPENSDARSPREEAVETTLRVFRPSVRFHNFFEVLNSTRRIDHGPRKVLEKLTRKNSDARSRNLTPRDEAVETTLRVFRSSETFHKFFQVSNSTGRIEPRSSQSFRKINSEKLGCEAT